MALISCVRISFAPAGKWHEYWEEAKAHGDQGDKSATQHYEEMTAKVKDMVPDAIKNMVSGTDNEMHTSVRPPAPPCDMWLHSHHGGQGRHDGMHMRATASQRTAGPWLHQGHGAGQQ